MPQAVRAGRYQLAMVIAIVAAGLSALSIGVRLDLRPTVLADDARAAQREEREHRGKAPAEEKTDREIDEEIAQKTAVKRVELGAAALLGTPARIVGLAFALFLLGHYVGGKPSLIGTISVASHAALPWAVRSCVLAAAAWNQAAVQPDQIDALVSRGLNVTLPHPVLEKLAGGIDLFTLWSVLIAGFGLAAAAGISRKRSFAAVLAGFAVYLMVTQLIAGGEPPRPAEVP